MPTYEDGLRECKNLLLTEAEGFDHAAAVEGDSNPGKIFASMAAYFRTCVRRIEEREAFVAKIGALGDGEAGAFGDDSFNTLLYRLKTDLESSPLPPEQLEQLVEGWRAEIAATLLRLNGRQEG